MLARLAVAPLSERAKREVCNQQMDVIRPNRRRMGLMVSQLGAMVDQSLHASRNGGLSWESGASSGLILSRSIAANASREVMLDSGNGLFPKSEPCRRKVRNVGADSV
jgi:hypothetical protein